MNGSEMTARSVVTTVAVAIDAPALEGVSVFIRYLSVSRLQVTAQVIDWVWFMFLGIRLRKHGVFSCRSIPPPP